jgi:hypothetical protein
MEGQMSGWHLRPFSIESGVATGVSTHSQYPTRSGILQKNPRFLQKSAQSIENKRRHVEKERQES